MLKTLIAIGTILAGPCLADEKAFDLFAPPELTETCFLKHILPRFSLKTGIRITLTDAASPAAFGTDGVPVFRRGDVIWHLAGTEIVPVERFRDWLLSEVGKRTIEGFAPEVGMAFSADITVREARVEVALDGDAVLGEELSLLQCGRCHVVNDANRMNAIGSSPSFALMRTFPDWQERFETFFMLKPHPSFTQVLDVTEPFPDHLPSPIAPIEVTLEEIEAITAYVGSIAPADLGAPIRSQ